MARQERVSSSGIGARERRISAGIVDFEKAAYALQTSELRYRRLFEAAQDGILLVDHATGKILDVNPFLIKMLGYSKASLLEKHLWEIGVFKDIVASKKNFRTLQRKNYIRYEDMPLETKDGKKIEVEFVSNVYQVNGTKTIQCNIRDITDRKKAERILRKLQNEQQTILDSIHAWIFYKDRNGRFVRVNKALCDAMNKSREQLEGKSIYDFYPKKQADAFRKDDREVIVSGKAKLDIIEPMQTPTGMLWAQTDKIPYRDEHGDIIGTIGLSIDITERKKAAYALQTSELRYRRLFEAAQDGILLVDHATGKILDVNPFLIKMLGYSKANFLKRHLWEIGVFKDIVASKKKFRTLQEKNYVRYEDLPLETKSGKKIEVEFVSNVYQVNGTKTIQCNIRDITDRKGMERKIFSILAAMGDAVVACDRDGRIVLFNNVAENFTGIPAEKALKRDYRQVMKFANESDGKKTYAWITEAVQKNTTTRMPDNMILVGKDGKKIPVSDSVVPIKDAKGNAAGFTMVFHNVTKERSIEKAKNEFVSLASHQLRTPLTEIRWALSNLQEDGGIAKEAITLVETAHKASSHMAETIKAMLILSHIETGEIHMEPIMINLYKIIDDVVHLHDAMKVSQQIRLQIDCPKNIRIHTDEQLLKEILSNLLTNAYKYTSSGGSVHIAVKKKKGRIGIDVADTGIGIPRQEQKKVFEKFFRGSNVVDKWEGNGIGLNIVHVFVAMLGGTISLVSRENKGTTFSLILPSSL